MIYLIIQLPSEESHRYFRDFEEGVMSVTYDPRDARRWQKQELVEQFIEDCGIDGATIVEYEFREIRRQFNVFVITRGRRRTRHWHMGNVYVWFTSDPTILPSVTPHAIVLDNNCTAHQRELAQARANNICAVYSA